MPAPQKKTLLFRHVQKTGGSTLSGALANRFTADECLDLYFGTEPDLSNIDRFRYVSGHLDASFIKRFADPPFVLTVLRDPIDRALSAYSYSRSFPPNSPLPPPMRVGVVRRRRGWAKNGCA